MTQPLHVILIPVLAGTLSQAQDPALPVVMVADLAGKVLCGGGQPLALAEGIPAHRRLTLEAGARLVVIYLKTGEEITFHGPGSISFDPEGRPLGAKPIGRKKIATLGAGFRLEPGAWAQASVVMRKEFVPEAPFLLAAEEPMPFNPPSAETTQSVWLKPRGTAILENQPEFHWHLPLPGLASKLRLSESTGKPVFEEILRGDVLPMPAKKILHPGATYRWELSWTLPDGQEQHAEGGFTVLPEVEAQLIQSLRPAQDAPFAERLAFAVALESRGLLDAAQPYWRGLAAERPGDSTLERFVTP